jgi:hypothetical protein
MSTQWVLNGYSVGYSVGYSMSEYPRARWASAAPAPASAVSDCSSRRRQLRSVSVEQLLRSMIHGCNMTICCNFTDTIRAALPRGTRGSARSLPLCNHGNIDAPAINLSSQRHDGTFFGTRVSTGATGEALQHWRTHAQRAPLIRALIEVDHLGANPPSAARTASA